jgi:N-acetylneuraminate epimerase
MSRLIQILSLVATLSAPAADWTSLTPLPDAEGFAAPFAGVSGGALIVAGGANIPEDKWAEKFTKVWRDKIFVLERPDSKTWLTGFTLPRPLGYGVSFTVDEGVWCFGGSDSERHYADGFRLDWRKGKVQISTLPILPKPCANACGALVGRTLYIAGGIQTPASTTALSTFWALDLESKPLKWKELPTWPGPARMLAVAGSAEGSFFLFSGASLSLGPDGKAQRQYLTDAYRYDAERGWSPIAELPRAAVAAASPAWSDGGEMQIFSGDDGANVSFTPVKQHPGFPRDTLSYDIASDTWSTIPGLPFSRATVPTVQWGDQCILPNGEVRPRLRTPEVWSRR